MILPIRVELFAADEDIFTLSKYTAEPTIFNQLTWISVLDIYIYIYIYKYYVMNYSINSFTGASEAPVNVVVVY